MPPILSFLDHLLLLRGGRGLDPEVPPDEELRKEVKVAPVHDERGDVVLLPDVARPPLHGVGVVVKRHDRHADPDEHLRELHERHDDGVEPLGPKFRAALQGETAPTQKADVVSLNAFKDRDDFY